jgi:hypothetical protein
MYRTENGEKKFSFTRFMSNASPVLAGAPQDTELSSQEQDTVFMNQLGEPDPLILSPQAFLNAGITSASKTSAAIHKALLKNGVLEQDSSTVNTRAITSQFAHQLSMITSHAQKKLVNLLFFWEEEVQRWKVLIGELEELRVVIEAEKESGGNVGTYEKRLAELEGMMKLRPSFREEQAKGNETLPKYVGK